MMMNQLLEKVKQVMLLVGKLLMMMRGVLLKFLKRFVSFKKMLLNFLP